MPVIQLADVKAHLNVTIGDDDALITAQIAAAEALLEQQTGKAFLTQTLTASFDRFDRSLEIFRGPVQSITAITYLEHSPFRTMHSLHGRSSWHIPVV